MANVVHAGEVHCREHHSALQLPSASGKSSALVWTVPLGRGVASTQHHQLPCPPAANTARLWYFHPGLPTPWKWQIRSRRNQQTSGERTALRGACRTRRPQTGDTSFPASSSSDSYGDVVGSWLPAPQRQCCHAQCSCSASHGCLCWHWSHSHGSGAFG